MAAAPASAASASTATAIGGKLLFIERGHPAVPEAIRRLVTGENHVANSAVRDFDGNEFFIDFADEGTTLTISIRHSVSTAWFAKHNCTAELKSLLEKRFAVYGPDVKVYPTPLEGMTATIGVSTAVLMQDPSAVPSLAVLKEASALRLLCLQAVFNTAFDKFLKGTTGATSAPGTALKVPYRSGDGTGEFMFLYVHSNNFHVSMNIVVPDADDRLFVKSFLQSFADARKLEKSIGSAPSFLTSQETAPQAFAQVGFAAEASGSSSDTVWVTFVLSKKNMEPAAKAELSVLHLMNFRTYLFYHIQTCRSYMHSKMRERMSSALQVLNRAKTKATGKAKVQID